MPSLKSLMLKKQIEEQKKLDEYLAEVNDYFLKISDESEKENIKREKYWIKKAKNGEFLKDITVDANGNEISFFGNADIKPEGCHLKLTQEHIDEFAYCAYHPIYTITNYFKIVSEDRGLIPFEMYDFQKQLVRNFFKYNRNLAMQSRQSGKCVTEDTVIEIIQKPTKGIKHFLFKVLDKFNNNFFGKIVSGKIYYFNWLYKFVISHKRINFKDLIKETHCEFIQCKIDDLEGNLKFIGELDIRDNEIYVKGENGYIKVLNIYKTVPYKKYTIQTNLNLKLSCADKHIVKMWHGQMRFVKDLNVCDEIYTENGIEMVKSIVECNQKENMYDLELDQEHWYYTNRILSHNTTTVAAMYIFYAMFNREKTMGIISLKRAGAIEVLDRIKNIYLNLPMWLKPAVRKWNQGSIEFANGCRIIASATTGASIRGKSLACVTGDTYVTVRSKEHGIERISMEELKKRLEKPYNIDENEYDIVWEYDGGTDELVQIK